MMMKKTTKSKTVQVPEDTVRTTLYFLSRVVVHGDEQQALFNAYASLMKTLNDPPKAP